MFVYKIKTGVSLILLPLLKYCGADRWRSPPTEGSFGGVFSPAPPVVSCGFSLGNEDLLSLRAGRQNETIWSDRYTASGELPLRRHRFKFCGCEVTQLDRSILDFAKRLDGRTDE